MPRRQLLTLTLASLLIMLQGCSSVNSAMGGNTQKEAKAEVSWDYKRDGIQIELMASTDINAYFNQSHTLMLGIMQLEDSKPFLKLLSDKKTLAHMLASGDPGKEILHMDRYVISPDKRTILNIDRVQNAKFVGIVAGYYDFDPTRAARLFRIPLNIQTEGLISTSYKAEPANLALRLYLGRQQITNAQSLTFDPDKKPDVETIPLEQGDPEIKLNDKTLQQAGDAADAARKLRQ